MKLARWMLTLAVVCTLALAGCGEDENTGTTPAKTENGKTAVQTTTPTTPAVTVGAQDSPKATLQGFAAALKAGKTEQAIAFVDPAFAKPMGTLFALVGRMEKANNSLVATVESKLGKETADKVRASQKSGPGSMSEITDLDIAKVKFVETGDTAKATVEGESTDLDFKKIAGKWYMTFKAEQAPKEEDVAKMNTMFDAMLKGMAEVEAGVKAGTITAENFEEKQGEIMMKAMMAGMPTPPAPEPSTPTPGD